MKEDSTELFPIVDELGNIIGSATRGECHSGSKLLHPVVHLHVFNSKENYFYKKGRHGKTFNQGNGIHQ